jgi:predicted DNA-binding WGR domain protein
MERREFTFSEGSSNKFWAVWVDGTTMNVHFGKVGTKGQTQQKEFGSEAEAIAAAQKLIAEKTKKGYAEGAASEVAPPVPKKKQELEDIADSKDVHASQEPQAAPIAKRSMRPFDFEACKQRLIDNAHQPEFLTWSAEIGAEEAFFWLVAYSVRFGRGTGYENDRALRELTPKAISKPTADQVSELLSQMNLWEMNIPLLQMQSAWLAPAEFFDLLCTSPILHHSAEGPLQLAHWLEEVYFPRQSEAAIAEARAKLREQLGHEDAPIRMVAAVLAGGAGMPEELNAFFAKMKKGALNASQLQFGWGVIVFGLKDPARMIAEARRLGLRFVKPEHARTWLQRTGTAGLDILRVSILGLRRAEEQIRMLDVLLSVPAADAAQPLLEVRLGVKAPEAKAWIDAWFKNHPEETAAGLSPWAEEVSPRGEAVRAILGSISPPASLTAAVPTRAAVADHSEWLPGALASVKKVKNISFFADFATLPPLPGLTTEDVPRVLTALMESTLAAPHPLVAALRRHGDRDALAAFAWALFERWLAADAPSKEKWALLSLGYFGDDTVAMKLTPLIRVWPGESQHQRAVTGLEILRNIGSDVALMQLNGIALKLKFKGLQDRARQMMDLIAQDRGLSREQLEDRIVPDLGLDTNGSRVFDFGPRRFFLVFEEELSPTVRDESGKVLKDLPKPGAKDDATLASQAAEGWKAFKKQWRETVKIQLTRLEEAMITGRAWLRSEWQTLLVQHPLMQHLVRRLLWQQGNAFFRVDAAGQALHHDGSAVMLGEEPVRIGHRLRMTEGQLGSWRQAMQSAGITPLVEQLDRRVFMPGGNAGVAVGRPTEAIPSITLRSKLEDRGWRRLMHDQGGITGFSKVYPSAGITAVVQTADTILIGMTDDSPNGIAEAFFVAGTNHPHGSCSDEFADNLPRSLVNEVDPVAYSETVRDLMNLVPRGKG